MSLEHTENSLNIAIVGGGAAGYFAAICCAEQNPAAKVCILEGTRRTLNKVRISGGGRCNVTHACFEPRELTGNYPRGNKELLGPFHRFQPEDTIKWFAKRGVELKREDDGRMFPITDNSETIASCLENVARGLGIELRLGVIAKSIAQDNTKLRLKTRDTEELFDRIILATGSSPSGYQIAAALGHSLVPPVPSLFTFNINDARLTDQAGISFKQAELKLQTKTKVFKQTGPLLITHWGLSGPAVLKLSAWAARELHDCNYQATLNINFMHPQSLAAVCSEMIDFKKLNPRKQIATEAPVDIVKRYWQRIVQLNLTLQNLTWADLSHDMIELLSKELTSASFAVSGKGVFKEEFVTAGGIPLKEVDFRTMQSRCVPGLYFAGEILDVDGVTGGFNFQNAWTTGFTAGSHAASRI